MRASSILIGILGKGLCGVHSVRLRAVFAAVNALLIGGRLTLTGLGRAIPTGCVKHNIKRVDRLLGNRHLHREIPTFYAGIAAAVLPSHSRPILIVDWTKASSDFYTLAVSLPVGGRCIPIYAETHPRKKQQNAAVESRFLKNLAGLLPAGCRPALITDAGFKTPWLKRVRERGWDFVSRVPADWVAIVPASNPDEELVIRDLHAGASETAKCHEDVLLTRGKLQGRLVVYRAQKHRSGTKKRKKRGKKKRRRNLKHHNPSDYRKRALDPWVLVTSLEGLGADEIVSLYKTRMKIEEQFRDTKNARLGWSLEYYRGKSAKRYNVMFMLAALATFLVTLIGWEGERRAEHRSLQANTRRQRALSLFRVGWELMRRRTAPWICLRLVRTILSDFCQELQEARLVTALG